jgi:hypothetical protein
MAYPDNPEVASSYSFQIYALNRRIKGLDKSSRAPQFLENKSIRNFLPSAP